MSTALQAALDSGARGGSRSKLNMGRTLSAGSANARNLLLCALDQLQHHAGYAAAGGESRHAHETITAAVAEQRPVTTTVCEST
jgi:hypothetical protein